MKLKFYLLTSFFLFVALFLANAQTTCNYRLELLDSYGDGWNGASLGVTIAGETTSYTVPEEEGEFNADITITDGATVTLDYSLGEYETEVSYFLYDSENVVVFSDGPSPNTGVVYNNDLSCPTCLSIDPVSFDTYAVPNGAELSWEATSSNTTYIIEYGLAGFSQGTGAVETSSTSSYSVTSAQEGTAYEAYITVDCGSNDMSTTIGPLLFSTGYASLPVACEYTLNMTDSYGDGWNGASIDISLNGLVTNYTILETDNDGYYNNVNIPVIEGQVMTLTYNSGVYDNEVSYELINSAGIVVFSDGPNPTVGEAYTEITDCPSCVAVDDTTIESTATPGGADLAWGASPTAGTYIIEYGPLGFTPGTGTVITTDATSYSITDQEEGTPLNFYITVDCGDGDMSVTVGPALAITGYLSEPDFCVYTLNMMDSYGDGWNGASLDVSINGLVTSYTVLNTDNDGNFNIVPLSIVEGALITLTYNSGSFSNEVTYELLNPDGVAVFSDGPSPASGLVYEGVGECPACIAPSILNLEVTTLGLDATIDWEDVSGANSFTVEYGVGCFEVGQGTTVTTNESMVEITDLLPNSLYSYFLSSDCGDEGSSVVTGPFFFETTAECIAPLNADIFLEGVDQVAIDWTSPAVSNTNEYIIEYGPVGFPLGGGEQSAPTSTSPTSITGLDPNTVYDFYVYANCDGTNSTAVGPITATTDLVCPEVSDIVSNLVTSNSAQIAWVGNASSYVVEYGPAGFEQGSGIEVTSTNPSISLSNFNPGIGYDVYVTADCGNDGQSLPIGPISFTTEMEAPSGSASGVVCTHTLELYDSYGDGWNGASLTVTNGAYTETFTIAGVQGEFITTFEVTSGEDLTLTYVSGTFDNEVTYVLYNNEGSVVYSDGPFPTIGLAYSGIALCPSCPSVVDASIDARAETADLEWTAADNSQEYVVEWGSVGFTLGSGTSMTTTDTEYTIEGLTPNTWYNAYITSNCGAEDGYSTAYGPIAFKTYILNDVGIVNFVSPAEGECVYTSEDISVSMKNFGQNPQQLVPYYYSLDFVNAAVENPVDGYYTGVISQDSVEVIDFDAQVDFSEPGYYFLEAWTALPNDENPSNDRHSYEFVSAYPFPINENFNSVQQGGPFVEGWTGDPILTPVFLPTGIPNAPTSVVAGSWLNTFGTDTLKITTPRYGAVQSNSMLTFDYRFVAGSTFSGFSNYNMDDNDKLEVLVSTDCGDTFDVVSTFDSSNSNINGTYFKQASVDLSAYAGQSINIQFLATNNGSGSFYFQMDNVNVLGCPSSMFIQIDQSEPETFSTGNGSLLARPTFGIAPFSFSWSNGQTTAWATNLGFTDYTVTVTDANGCTDIRTYETILTDTEETLNTLENVSLVPNPNTGNATLKVDLPEASDIAVTVYDLAGRTVATYQKDNQLNAQFNLDLNEQPNGLYLVKINAANQTRVVKMAIAK